MLSKMTTSASNIWTTALISSTRPVPTYTPVLIWLTFCVSTPTTSMSQASARLSNSFNAVSNSGSLFKFTPTSSAFVLSSK